MINQTTKNFTIDDLKAMLHQNGELLIEAVMRIAALEKLLVSKGLCTEAEILQHMQDNYAIVLDKLKESSGDGNVVADNDEETLPKSNEALVFTEETAADNSD